MNAFNNTNVQLKQFSQSFKMLALMYLRHVMLPDGRNMRCAQVLLEQHTHEQK